MSMALRDEAATVRETKPGHQYRNVVEGLTKAAIESGAVALHSEEGREYFYRPHQLLVSLEALPALEQQLPRGDGARTEIDELLGASKGR